MSSNFSPPEATTVADNTIQLRSAYNYDPDEVSKATGLDFEGQETMTQQQFAEECDINTIVKRFGLTGQLPNGINMPQSGDFTEVTDFHTAMNLVREAEQAFLQIPGDVRARFNHDPAEVMKFLDDDKNRAEAIALGFIPKPPEQTRASVDTGDKT